MYVLEKSFLLLCDVFCCIIEPFNSQTNKYDLTVVQFSVIIVRIILDPFEWKGEPSIFYRCDSLLVSLPQREF